MEGLVMTTRALLGGAAILAIASVPPTIADAQSASPQKSSASCEVVSKLSFKGTMAQRRAESTEDWHAPPTRTEEHTSELQSLLRISYAVFCLKTKTQHRTKHE